MTTLESYLTGNVLRDRADIAAIERALHETAETIIATFNGSHWPYEVTRDAPFKKGNLSQSTTAMMIRAIDLVLAAQEANATEPSYTLDFDKSTVDQLDRIRQSAVASLRADIGKSGSLETISRTYGRNDPLTLSFLAEIFPATHGTSEPTSTFLKTEALRLVNLDPGRELTKFFNFERKATDPDDLEFEISTPLSNAF